jgi:hypothetical protein
LALRIGPSWACGTALKMEGNLVTATEVRLDAKKVIAKGVWTADGLALRMGPSWACGTALKMEGNLVTATEVRLADGWVYGLVTRMALPMV